jgi:hypothetical protein
LELLVLYSLERLRLADLGDIRRDADAAYAAVVLAPVAM